MSTPDRRRNGSQASCEPCRKSKSKCDHQKPVCARCRRRGREPRCFYHPAPLTRQRASTSTRRLDDLVERVSIEDDSTELGDSCTITDSAGSTPRVAAWSFMYNEHPDSGLPTQPLVPDSQKNTEENLAAIREIAFLLTYFSFIKRLVEEYFSFSQAAIVPHPIVRQLFESIKSSVCNSAQSDDALKSREPNCDISGLTATLLRSRSDAASVTSSLDLGAFCALFSGPRLRVETLGLMYTIAARSYLYSRRRDDKSLDSLVERLIRCSNLSLRLSHELAAQDTNDVIVWLGLENVQLTSLLEGHGSLSAWRRLGDLTTDVYALEMHREESYSADKIPFYLAEFRRRTFGFVSYLDKAFVTMFSQPPRMSSRYADCRLFLDLSDEEVVDATTQGLGQLQKTLTSDGWNTDGSYRNTTWARLRYSWSELEQSIVDIKFGPPQVTDVPKLRTRELLKRSQEHWNNLPQHLRYDSECWTSKLPPGTCLMLAKVYLSYLQLSFQMYKLLSNIEGNNASTQSDLLEISAKMLDTSVHIANARAREGYFPYPVDLTSYAFQFGLPAAALLTTALQEAAQDPLQSLPPSINKACLIRNISVLISHLESLFAYNETQSTEQASCRQASKTISRRLDQILEGVFGGPTAPTPSNVGAVDEGLDSSSTVNCSGFPSFVPIGDEDMNLEGAEHFDFDTWAITAVFDLETAKHDWNMF